MSRWELDVCPVCGGGDLLRRTDGIDDQLCKTCHARWTETDLPWSREMQTCPRRMNEFGPWERQEGLDYWEIRDGNQTCSFCGSLHPADVLEWIREGYVLEPTDKNYKVYLSTPIGADAAEKVRADAEELAGDIEGGARADFIEHYVKHTPIITNHVGKFYFQHLDAEQQSDFIELHNEQLMSIGHPGRFYVTPYFCSTA